MGRGRGIFDCAGLRWVGLWIGEVRWGKFLDRAISHPGVVKDQVLNTVNRQRRGFRGKLLPGAIADRSEHCHWCAGDLHFRSDPLPACS